MATQMGAFDLAMFLTSVLALFLVIFVTRIRSILRGRLPPGPRGWPLFGSVLELGDLPHQSLQALARKHGPLMFMYMGSIPTLVVSSAEMAREVLLTNDQNTASRPHLITPNHSGGFKDVASSPYGPNWLQVRKIATLHLLAQAPVDRFQDVRKHEVVKMVQHILNQSQKGDPILVLDVFRNLTAHIMTQMMWEKGNGSETGFIPADGKGTEFRHMIQATYDPSETKKLAQIIPVFKPLALRLLGNKMKFVYQLRHDSMKASSQEQGKDKVKSLLEARDNVAAKRVLLDMLIGGTEPLAATLEWGLVELMRHPEVMRKAQDELVAVVGSDQMVEEKHIPSLKYLQALVKETFRLHPANPLAFPHAAAHNSKIGDFHVPARTVIFINVYAIQTDPARWDRPMEFDPERFLGSHSSVDFRGRDFNLIPFSAGRRMCPGVTLVSSILHLALAQLLHAFTWTSPINGKSGTLDISEHFALACRNALPLRALATPRLAEHVLLSA